MKVEEVFLEQKGLMGGENGESDQSLYTCNTHRIMKE